MIKLQRLIKKTDGYSVIQKEKRAGALSHAYLVLCKDGDNLTDYLKILASGIVCKSDDACFTCRDCKLICGGIHTDVLVYPKEDESVKVEDIEDLIEQSYLKPLELDKKIFIITHAEKMNAQAQNKLLKTLEEPPKNVIIILGATSEYGLLSTILSRVKKLYIREFNEEELKEYFDYDESAKIAISMSDGTVGDVKRLLSDESFSEMQELCLDVIENMKSSRDVLEYSSKITATKSDFSLLLSMLELYFRDMLMAETGATKLAKNSVVLDRLKMAEGYSKGALIGIIECINECRKRAKFNANQNMLTEWALFRILEEKYKWQKL